MRALLKKLILWALSGDASPASDPAALDQLAKSLKK